MEDIIEIIKLTVPSLVVFLTAYFLLKNFLEEQTKQKELDQVRERDKIVLPLQLQAYERMVLFLERINPETLVFRLYDPNLSVDEYKNRLIQSIREEFDHNLSQQVYMSHEAWQLIRSAKEDVIRIIHVAYSRLGEKKSLPDFISYLFEEDMKSSETMLNKAMQFLKKEVQSKFNF